MRRLENVASLRKEFDDGGYVRDLDNSLNLNALNTDLIERQAQVKASGCLRVYFFYLFFICSMLVIGYRCASWIYVLAARHVYH